MQREKSYLKKPEWGIGEPNEGYDGNAGNRGRNHFSD